MLRSSLLRHEMSRPLAGGHPLTFAGLCGLLVAPNQVRRNTRLSCLPRVGKSRVAYSAVGAPAVRLPGGWLSHIGRVVTSSIREDWRLHLSRGALRPAFFVFHHPKSSEAPMYPITFASVAAHPCNLIPAGEVHNA